MRHFPLSKATHYEDRCQVEACPEPNSEAWHRCSCCGREPIEHHHVLRRSTHPDKVLDPNNIIPLCPHHHRLVSEHKWSDLIYAHPNGEMHYNVKDESGQDKCDRAIGTWQAQIDPGAMPSDKVAPVPAVPVARSKSEAKRLTAQTGHAVTVFTDGPLVYVDLPQDDPYEPVFHSPRMGIDWSSFSDEQLVVIYQDADERQGFAFMDKCHAIHTYRMRHDDWLEGAYDLFHASRRTLYAYSNVYEVCVTSDTHIVENIGPLTDSRSLMQFIGRKSVEEGRVALEAAVAHLAEFGEPPTVKALQHRLGQEAKPECEHEWVSVSADKCEKCGAINTWID